MITSNTHFTTGARKLLRAKDFYTSFQKSMKKPVKMIISEGNQNYQQNKRPTKENRSLEKKNEKLQYSFDRG